jgi:hypothetical protein
VEDAHGVLKELLHQDSKEFDESDPLDAEESSGVVVAIGVVVATHVSIMDNSS